MKYLILFLALLTTNVFANTVAGPNPSLQCADRLYTNLSNLVILNGGVRTAGNNTGLTDGDGDYQVPTGKQLRVICVRTQRISVSADHNFTMGYVAAGNGPIAKNTASAPVSPTWLWGRDGSTNNIEDTAIYLDTLSNTNQAAYLLNKSVPIDWVVPADSWLFIRIRQTGNMSVSVYGIEETP